VKLDRSTYEAWLLDHIEGNLTPSQERELLAFLRANPDLPVDADGLPTVDAPDPIGYAHKQELKKVLPPTGIPNRLRIEEFLIARSEGDLDAGQETALAKILFDHPEFEQLAKRIAESRVRPVTEHFTEKKTILREFPPAGLPDRHRLTDFLIARLEGDLSDEQLIALSAYVSAHPEAGRVECQVNSTRVSAEAVAFPHKERLKKREARVVALWPRLAIAASLAMLCGFAWWLLRSSESIPAPIAVLPAEVAPADTGNAQATDTAMNRRIEQPAPLIARRTSIGPVEERKASTPAHTPMTPAPVPQREQEPLVAETPPVQPSDEKREPDDQEPMVAGAVPSDVPVVEPAVAPANYESGSTIPALLANTVRGEVLGTDERSVGLDGSDVMALADKSIAAVTGGHGGVEVHRTATRDRVRLRLGRSFAISASKGH